jgi:hypothetical protein
MGTYPLSNKQGHRKKFLQKNLKNQGVRLDSLGIEVVNLGVNVFDAKELLTVLIKVIVTSYIKV